MRAETVKKAEAVAASDRDLAFDPTIDRDCDRKGCDARACWRPVLLLQPGRDYTGRPMRMPLGIVVCEAHKEKRVDVYLDDPLWEDVLAGFKARGLGLPHRASTRLDFDEHHGSEAEGRALSAAILEQVQDPVEQLKERLRGYAGRELSAEEQEGRDRLRFELRKHGREHASVKMRDMGFKDGQFEIVDKTPDELLDQGRFRCDVRFASREVPKALLAKAAAAGLTPILEPGTTE